MDTIGFVNWRIGTSQKRVLGGLYRPFYVLRGILRDLLRILVPAAFALTIIAGCETFGGESQDLPTATPGFITATLPPSPTAAPTGTPPPPSPVPTIPPVEGRTTAQLNVRADTSTASASLGVIPSFTQVQVIGRDASGNWYRIVFGDSETGAGWVRAEFVRVNAPAQIQVVRTGTGSGAGVSGVILQRINVRSGPGAGHESLGILNPKDVVSVLGKDASGNWAQIEFASAPDGTGWVAAEFIEVQDFDSLPIIGAVETSDDSEAAPAFVSSAAQDGDTLESPIAQARLEASGARAFQVSGEISAPEGDNEDWIGFSADGNAVVIEIQCSGNSPQAELWNNGKTLSVFSCGERRIVNVIAEDIYHLRIFEPGAGDFRHARYVVKVERAW